MRPIVIAGLEYVFDQAATKARAVDEEVRAETLATGEHKIRDVAAGRVEADVDDTTLDPLYPPSLAVTPEVPGVETRIEMKRIGDVGKRGVGDIETRPHEFAGVSRNLGDRVGLQRVGTALEAHLLPALLEGRQLDILPVAPEAVH